MTRRRWSEDERATVRNMYVCGLMTSVIGHLVSRNRDAVKKVIHGLVRDPSRFDEGIKFLLLPGERFSRVPFADYCVTDFGRVFSLRMDNPCRELNPETDKDGYKRVNLLVGGARVHHLVHRLVAKAFIGDRSADGLIVAHNDGSRDNNHYSNLRWCTQKENIGDKKIHGTWQECDRHPAAKTTMKQAIEAKRLLAKGATIAQAASMSGATYSTVAVISCGKGWRSVP